MELDCGGYVVLPGLVDGHTHPVWAGDRCQEFACQTGGGHLHGHSQRQMTQPPSHRHTPSPSHLSICAEWWWLHSTVRACDAASEESLLKGLLSRLQRALAQGTVLMEAKSGYGLSLQGECKLMRVLQRAQHLHPMDLVVNYCGAHSIPLGSTASQAAASIIHDLPEIVRRKAEGEFNPELIDVFCETANAGVAGSIGSLTLGACQPHPYLPLPLTPLPSLPHRSLHHLPVSFVAVLV